MHGNCHSPHTWKAASAAGLQELAQRKLFPWLETAWSATVRR